MKRMLKDIAILIRPHHWVKNLLVVAPSFFGEIVFKNSGNFLIILMAFTAFSFISSAGYIINDLLDSKQDKLHPKKKKRPLASGRISKNIALIIISVLFTLSILISLKINIYFLLTCLIYLFVTTLYSLILKKIVVVDALCIAAGFLLRIIAGGFALNVHVSNWLYLTTLLLSLLLAFGKRRGELDLVKKGHIFREVLNHYNEKFLDRSIIFLALASIITFSVYSIGEGWKIFITTTPFICFGTLRYLHLIKHRSKSDPTEALLKDRWMFISVLSWIILFGLIIYI
ncbi:MAG: UbiA prenyltransferase family protein [Thermodesulfobacteriota bacterium]